MDVMDAIKKRRSVRKFLDKPVEDEKVMRLIEAANWCPTASNMQAYRFIIISDQKLKEELVRIGGASFIKDAPLGILVVYSNETGNIEYQDYIQSASAAIQNILLAACDMGLGTCWICDLPPKERLRELLGIPKNYDPIAYIALGYYDKLPEPAPRKHDIDELISYNSFDFEAGKQKSRRFIGRIYQKIKPRKDDYWCRKCGQLIANCKCKNKGKGS